MALYANIANADVMYLLSLHAHLIGFDSII